jgi:hypothetical protein
MELSSPNGVTREREMANLLSLTDLMLIKKETFGSRIEEIIEFRNLMQTEIFSWLLALRGKAKVNLGSSDTWASMTSYSMFIR